MFEMYGLSSIYFSCHGIHDIHDIHDSQSEIGLHNSHDSHGVQSEIGHITHLQEIAIEYTIHTLDLDLGCCERYVRKHLTVLALEFIAFPS